MRPKRVFTIKELKDYFDELEEDALVLINGEFVDNIEIKEETINLSSEMKNNLTE